MYTYTYMCIYIYAYIHLLYVYICWYGYANVHGFGVSVFVCLSLRSLSSLKPQCRLLVRQSMLCWYFIWMPCRWSYSLEWKGLLVWPIGMPHTSCWDATDHWLIPLCLLVVPNSWTRYDAAKAMTLSPQKNNGHFTSPSSSRGPWSENDTLGQERRKRHQNSTTTPRQTLFVKSRTPFVCP